MEDMRALVSFLSIMSLANCAGITAAFKGSADIKFAEHLTNPAYPSSERLDLNGEQKFVLSEFFTTVVGGRAWYETVYHNAYDKYPDNLRRLDAREVRLQDAYLEYQEPDWIFRLGNQQVAWGETFGNTYSDVVNPKDLREGLPLNSGRTRLSVPMANLKYKDDHTSVQALWMWHPEGHVLPQPGSDFFPISASGLGFNRIGVTRERVIASAKGEYGGRVTQAFGKLDVGAIYLSHYDRYPYYVAGAGSVPGQVLQLLEKHARMQTYGISGAMEYEGFVGRAEVIRNGSRAFPVLQGGQIAKGISDENVGVASVDFPSWRSINLTLQATGSDLTYSYSYLLRRRQETGAGLRAQISLFTSSTLEVIFSHAFSDGGQRTQAEFVTPISSTFELRLGGELYGGPKDSQFGRIHRASRAYISLSAFTQGLRVSESDF